jgi:hypothetical protein
MTLSLFVGLLVTASLSARQPAVRPPSDRPLLVVMEETGTARDGLPVYTEHEDSARYLAGLSRGFSGRMLRVFRWEQQWLAAADGRTVEPAYLLLSNSQGGFPRFGFWLDDDRKGDVGYVDLHRNKPAHGRFGALDQIFPHELAHVIVRQLSGSPPDGPRSNQVHAVGVRTDPVLAFNEGFAETAQILAIDDPDAAPETAALGQDPAVLADTARRFEAYRRAMVSRWSPAAPARLGFLFWFPRAEQAARYHLVKTNRFAREFPLPPRLIERRDPYAAYLLDNVMPGSEDGPLKSTPRLLSTEGAIASLFWRWTTSDDLRSAYREPEFYERFGAQREDVDPIENVYLKILSTLASARPHDTRAFVAAYVSQYPGEAAAVEHVVRASGFDLSSPAGAEIWLAAEDFATGTSVFDQFRGLPRVHTFDLNAAGPVDLLLVQGITPAIAGAIQSRAPYRSLADLGDVPGVTAELVGRFEAMSVAATAAADDSAEDAVVSLGMGGLLRPVLYRAALWILLCSVASAWLLARTQTLGRRRVAVNGVTAASVGLLATWVLTVAVQVESGAGPVGWLVTTALTSDYATPFMPVWLFGLPGALWQVGRRQPLATAARVLAGWMLACLPAFAVTRSLF